jgi:hypothetical protein
MKGLLPALLALLICDAHAATLEAERKAFFARQEFLDTRCEAARQVLLSREKGNIYNECINAKRGTETVEACRRRAENFNANRIGGTPRHYDLPE